MSEILMLVKKHKWASAVVGLFLADLVASTIFRLAETTTFESQEETLLFFYGIIALVRVLETLLMLLAIVSIPVFAALRKKDNLKATAVVTVIIIVLYFVNFSVLPVY